MHSTAAAAFLSEIDRRPSHARCRRRPMVQASARMRAWHSGLVQPMQRKTSAGAVGRMTLTLMSCPGAACMPHERMRMAGREAALGGLMKGPAPHCRGAFAGRVQVRESRGARARGARSQDCRRLSNQPGSRREQPRGSPPRWPAPCQKAGPPLLLPPRCGGVAWGLARHVLAEPVPPCGARRSCAMRVPSWLMTELPNQCVYMAWTLSEWPARRSHSGRVQRLRSIRPQRPLGSK